MTTYNRHYKSKKFFLCVHTGEKNTIGFEHESNRLTQFSFIHHGNGTYYAFDSEGNISTVKGNGKEEKANGSVWVPEAKECNEGHYQAS